MAKLSQSPVEFLEPGAEPDEQAEIQRGGLSVKTIAKGLVIAVAAVAVGFLAYRGYQYLTSKTGASIASDITKNPFTSTVSQICNLGCLNTEVSCDINKFFNSLKTVPATDQSRNTCPKQVGTSGVSCIPPTTKSTGVQKSSKSGGLQNQCLVYCCITGAYYNPACIDPSTGLAYATEQLLFGICPSTQQITNQGIACICCGGLAQGPPGGVGCSCPFCFTKFVLSCGNCQTSYVCSGSCSCCCAIA